MLSTSSKYALKAVLYLALHTNNDRKMKVKEMSSQVTVPKAYLAKLLQDLAKRNLISSTRGPKGGFYLSERNKSQPLSSIIYAIEGHKSLNSCLIGLDYCNEDKPCPLHHLLSASRDQILNVIETVTIEAFAADLEAKKTFLL